MLLFLILFILVFMQSSFMPVNLLLVLILSTSIIKSSVGLLIPFFVTGLVFDIVNVRLLGTTSLFYLFVFLIISTYQKKIKSRNILYMGIVGLCSFLTYDYLFLKSINPLRTSFELFFLLLSCFILNKFLWSKN